MGRKYVVKLFFLLLMLHLVSARRGKNKKRTSICPHYTFCSCYGDIRNGVEIYCFGTKSLAPVHDLLQTEFKGIVIKRLALRDCYLTSLPSYSFDNCTIQRFSSSCPFSEIEPNAFMGMKSLTMVDLENITLSEVPEALINLQNIETLNIKQHRFVSLGNTRWKIPSLKHLSVQYGYLEELPNATFSGMSNLEALNLAHNKLIYVDPEVLSILKFLKAIFLEYNFITSAEDILKDNNPKVINLKYNNLTSLNNVVHKGMDRLEKLDVSGNIIQEISSSTFGRKLEKLKYFYMEHANCANIKMSFLQVFPRLKRVYLGFNNLRHLPGYLFHSHQNLVTVDLQFNSITCSESLFDDIPKLQTLRVDHNSISSISDCFGRLLMLQTLQLSHNKIWRIEDTDFHGLVQIRTLILTHNQIEFIGLKSFTSLRYLTTLQLSHNRIRSLNGSLRYVTTITRLMLNSCKLETVTADDFFEVRKLTVLDLSNNNLSSVDGAFQYLEELTKLNLANNRLTTISRVTFPEQMKLKEISLAEGNSWSCDCRLQWLFEWLSHSNYKVLKDMPSCTLPRNKNGKFFHEISTKIGESQGDCPSSCHCTCNSNVLVSYLTIECSRKNISRVPADLPTSPFALDLSENNLKTVNISSGANEILSLNLEHNKIASFEIAFSPELTGLRLSDNMLPRPPLTILSQFSLRNVTLSRNPWVCDCMTVGFRDWLTKNRDKVMDLEEVKCSLGSSTGKAIYLLQDSDLCHTWLYIGLAIGFTCFMLTLVLIPCFRYQHHVRSLLYARGITAIKKEDNDTDSAFDGFLSYNWMDEQLVFTEIVPGLQDVKPHFTLSVPNRDVDGVHSSAFISQEIKRSKKILVLLTENYLRDENSMKEFRIAYNLCFEYKVKSLLFIKNGKVPRGRELDVHVKSALKSTVCITWGEKFFWERLRYAMPKKVNYANRENAMSLQEHPEHNEDLENESAV